MRRRKFIKRTGVGITSIAIAGCSGGDDGSGDGGGGTATAESGGDGGATATVGDGTAGDTESLETIEYLIPEGQLNIPVFFAGKDEGFWEERGIDLVPRVVGYGRYARALTTGDKVIGNMNMSVFTTAREQGENVVAIGGEQVDVTRTLARTDSGVSGPPDFPDVTFGVPSFQAGNTLVQGSMIQDEYGIDLREDIPDIVDTNAPALWQLMQSGEVDVGIQFTGFSVQGMASDDFEVVFDPLEYFRNQYDEDLMITFWGADGEWLDGNEDVALDFLDAVQEATDYTLNNSEDVFDQYGRLTGMSGDDIDVYLELAEQGDAYLDSVESWNQDIIDAHFDLFELLSEYEYIEAIPDKDDSTITYDQLVEAA